VCCINASLIDRLPPWLPENNIPNADNSQLLFYLTKDENNVARVSEVLFLLDISNYSKQYWRSSPSKYMLRILNESCKEHVRKWEVESTTLWQLTPDFVDSDTDTLLKTPHAHRESLRHFAGIRESYFGKYLAAAAQDKTTHLQVPGDAVLVSVPIISIHIDKVCFAIFQDSPTIMYPVFCAKVIIPEIHIRRDLWKGFGVYDALPRLDILANYKRSSSLSIWFAPTWWSLRGQLLL